MKGVWGIDYKTCAAKFCHVMVSLAGKNAAGPVWCSEDCEATWRTENQVGQLKSGAEITEEINAASKY